MEIVNNVTKIRCLKCGDIIIGDLHGNLIQCSCKSCSIDSTPYYCNINGNPDEVEVINREGNWILLSKEIEEFKNKNKPLDRIDKTNYYLDIAETVSERSTCLKRMYGAIVVNNDEIISSGFNGAPRGVTSCLEKGECLRENSDRGTDYSNCLSTHAEMNAIISASRKEMIGGTLYLVGKDKLNKTYVKNPTPCSICKRLIINSGIEKVIVRVANGVCTKFNVSDWKEKDIIGGY